MDYKKAGVDIEAGYKSVELMKEHVKKTMRPEVLGGLGGFAGAFDLSGIKNMEEPVLLSGTDGCGTKVKLAFVMDKHDTIGIDAVATVSYTHLLDFDEKVEKYDQHIVLYVDNIFVRSRFCYPHYQYEENILLKKKFK